MFEFLDLPRGIATASVADFWVGVTVAAVIALGGFVLAFYYFSRSRLMEDIPTSRVRSAAQGFVELEGMAEVMKGDPIVSPLTGAECAWYRFKVEKHVRSGRHNRWRTVDKGVSDALFLLRDATGICVIDPEGASVTPHQKLVWYGHNERPSHAPQRATPWYLQLGGSRYRYTEERLLPGWPLYAMGLFRTVGGANEVNNTSDEVRDLLADWKANPRELVQRFDRDGDGQVDMNEWQRARGVALAEVRDRQRERARQPGAHTLAQPGDRHPFLLSAKSQQELGTRFRWYAVSGLFAFFLIGGGAIWALTLRFA